MMGFRLPTFIAEAKIWRWSKWLGHVPPAMAPDVIVNCNLVPGRRVFEEASTLTSYILVPKLTDIRFTESGTWDVVPPSDPDLIEIPSGSGWYYTVNDVERVALGFANEHLEACITKRTLGGVIPPPNIVRYINTTSGASSGDFTVPATGILAGSLAHSMLVMGVTYKASASITVSDDVNGSWTMRVGVTYGAGAYRTEIWYITDSIAGSPNITVAPSSGTPITFIVQEFSGLNRTGLCDGTGANMGTGSSAIAGPDIVASAGLQIAACGCGTMTPVTFTSVSSPWYQDTDYATGADDFACSLAMIVNDPSSNTATWTLSTPMDWGAAWITVIPY